MLRRSLIAGAVAALALGALPAAAMPQAIRGDCGVWRWDVKTLSDPDRTDVNFDPQLTTVQALRTRDDQPSSLHTDTARIWPVEKKTYIVKARVISATIEDDSDIHLVISQRNATSRKMIVEFPAPACVASPFKRPAIAAAREAMLDNCGGISSSSFTQLSGNVEVTGVGFWDEIHGQTGVAPNGIELHPVLKFTGECSGGSGPAGSECSPAYPDFCIPPPPPDLSCADVAPHVNFTVLPPDPHGFDGNGNGIGCET
jgi:hypothetical protein